MAHPPISRDEVRRIAALAHLALGRDGDGDEVDRTTRELASILAHVKALEEVDVTDVLPTAHVQLERLPLRDDEPHPSLDPELALREAPKTSDGGFSVPGFVEEG